MNERRKLKIKENCDDNLWGGNREGGQCLEESLGLSDWLVLRDKEAERIKRPPQSHVLETLENVNSIDKSKSEKIGLTSN